MSLIQLQPREAAKLMFLYFSNLSKSFVSIRGHRKDFSGGLANYQTVHILWAENCFSYAVFVVKINFTHTQGVTITQVEMDVKSGFNFERVRKRNPIEPHREFLTPNQALASVLFVLLCQRSSFRRSRRLPLPITPVIAAL